ncbi:MAG TPA: cytochrome P450 [Acidimicrobiales bacterium]|jgi:cytochrome P450
MTAEIPGTSLLDPDIIDDPYPFYCRLQNEAPVWRVPGTDVFVVSTHRMVAEAASRVEDFSSNMRHLLYRGETGLPNRLSFGNAGADALATADPPTHKVHRDVVFSELVSKRMETLEPDISDLTEKSVGGISDGSIDFMADIGNVIPINVMTRLIGFRDGNAQELFEAAVDSTSMLGATLSMVELEQHIVRTLEIETWIGLQLEGAAEDPNDDILGGVARGVDRGVFTHQEGCVVLHTLLSAGGESTTSLLGNAVRMLAERPELQDRLRSAPELVPAFIEEALRLESPFRFLLRTTAHDTSLGDIAIPEDATVLLLWGAANRDAATFENADEIVLDRRVPRRHVAFGRGIHHCVGAPLARLEARIVLTSFLKQTKSFTLDLDSSPQWVQSLMIRRHNRLAIKVARS